MRKSLWTPLLVAIIACFLAACASDKGPAETAIKAAEDALAGARAEAAQYVPDQLKAVEDGIAALKANFAKGDYKAVLASAPDVTAKAQGLRGAAAAKKAELEAKAAEAAKKTAELTKTWTDMAEGLPKMVGALESRVDILSKAKTLPAKIDKATFEEAKTGLVTVKQTWAEAQEAFKGGKVEDAVAKATVVKDKSAEIMAKLGMQVPAAAKS